MVDEVMSNLTESEIHEQVVLKDILRNLRGKITPIVFRDQFVNDKEAGWILQRLVFLYGKSLGKWDSGDWKDNTFYVAGQFHNDNDTGTTKESV